MLHQYKLFNSLNHFRKISKLALTGFLLLATCLVIFHFWLLAHAENILQEVVNTQSRGKYHLDVKKVKYNYLKLKLELVQPVLTNVDTNKSGDQFEMHANLISLQLEKLWPLIAGRKLLIDSILLDRPTLDLIHEKRENIKTIRTTFSLSLEMEKLYQSIQSVLTTLRVHHFRINKGAFIFNTATQSNGPPLQIKNIDFLIKGFNIDSSSISQHPNSYTEDIQLMIAGQTIYFPDGNKSIKFSSFRFIANKGNLEVDSCSISGGDNDSTKTSFNLFAEKMRIRNVFIAMNDSTDYNRIDSLFFTKPKVTFSLQIRDTKLDSSQSVAVAIRKITSAAFGRVLVRYVSINNVDFDIEIEKNEKLSTFNFVQDSLVVSNLGVGVFPSMPLSASAIRFGVKEFVDYFSDSSYLVHFDSVRINNDQFSLFNINIESTQKVKKGQQKIFIPVLQIQGIDWFQLISQKRLVARNVQLNDPFISILSSGMYGNTSRQKKSDLDRLLRQMFVLKNIRIQNGSVIYARPGNESLRVNSINAFLNPDLSSPDLVATLYRMVTDFNSSKLVYRKGSWTITANKVLYGSGNSLIAGDIDLENRPRNFRLQATKVRLAGISGDAKINKLGIKDISWSNAKIVMDLLNNKAADRRSLLSIGRIKGGPTDFKLTGRQFNVQAKISRVNTSSILLKDGVPEALNNFFTEGTSIDITAGDRNFHSGKFVLNDRLPSGMSEVSANFVINQSAIDLSIPRVNFQTDIHQALQKQVEISGLSLVQPTIMIKPAPGGTNTGESRPFPDLNITNLDIKDPSIFFSNHPAMAGLQFDLGKSEISTASIKTADSGRKLIVNELMVKAGDFKIGKNNSWQVVAPGGMATVTSEKFTLFSKPKPGTGNWQLDNGGVQLRNILFDYTKNNGNSDSMELHTFKAAGLSISQLDLKDPVRYFSSGPSVQFSNLGLNFKTQTSEYFIKGMNGNCNSGSLDSFSYRPRLSADSFMSFYAFQKDYLTLQTGRAWFQGLDIPAWLRDSIIRINKIELANAIVDDTRDKHLPVKTDIIKGLPVTMIKNIPVKTMIDTVRVHNGMVHYHEVSDKTNQTGHISFTRLNASLSNIKNYNLLPGDSLGLLARAYLMDSAPMQLRMKQSYYDSLASFPITLTAKAFDLGILNAFLLPVMSVRIKSGVADSVQIRAIGREYLTLGEMRFFYHDLKVEFLTAAEDQKKTLLTSLKTFAANNFVIRTRNTKRYGKIFYERSRNRSFFNYLVRIVASGTASSVGARRNQKYNRLYNEKIRELHLPEIDFQPAEPVR